MPTNNTDTFVYDYPESYNPNGKIHHGKNIQRARGFRLMNQDVLAEKIGCSVDWLRELERRAVVEEKWLVKIAEATNARLEFLLYNENDECEIGFYNNQSNLGQQAQDIEIETYNDVNQIMRAVTPLFEKIAELEAKVKELEGEK